MYRVVLKSAVFLAASLSFVIPVKAVEVYLFKGAGDFSFVNDNLHFSRGLNEIADTLNAEGIHAEVRRFGAMEDALTTIRQRKPETVAFIGHSMGALASMALARNLRGDNIKIVYMGLIDIPGPVGVAGDNVAWVENYYSVNPVYGKLTNTASHPKAKNIHVSGYIHNRMDDSPQVQQGMLDAIRQIHAQENQAEPEQIPEIRHAQALPQVVHEAAPQTNAQLNQTSDIQQPQVEISDPQNQPYALPSVSVAGNAQPIPQSGDPLLSQVPQTPEVPQPVAVDTVTTSSVKKPGLVDRGRSLLRRAGGFVRRLNNRRIERANAFAPQPER